METHIHIHDMMKYEHMIDKNLILCQIHTFSIKM